ncbi:MAG: hypothetical protein A4E50_02015 [Methanosaeta sp. PtaB.Bin087]|nr:MAG: hypothetical protein A4E50_02015 [Methanosaeta sp. PtaB.Bin087]OPY51217.1 MAG: hypothetical protein A4E51_01574 [Methanosaeta sp. PtaU1.Bin055]
MGDQDEAHYTSGRRDGGPSHRCSGRKDPPRGGRDPLHGSDRPDRKRRPCQKRPREDAAGKRRREPLGDGLRPEEVLQRPRPPGGGGDGGGLGPPGRRLPVQPRHRRPRSWGHGRLQRGPHLLGGGERADRRPSEERSKSEALSRRELPKPPRPGRQRRPPGGLHPAPRHLRPADRGIPAEGRGRGRLARDDAGVGPDPR